ncbi:scoloptoxin SSD976-like [Homalodisca vitripennis]|uniref:scoloptoxin SSD976-like n=1 Tax=Homalodisca vitripennis TaxID=197043 RepID=UPI001EECD8AD|nr:scoloptoxin SSD976-like [Homalodisca vitripennis]
MTITKFLVIMTLCGILKETEGYDYCTVKGCQPREHTMCKYPANKPDCKVARLGLDVEHRKELLKVHNELRQKVAQGKEEGQPPAANMMKLSWNNEAEDIAQRWAERCTFAHDKCRTMKDGTRAGQNLAKASINSEVDTISKIVVKCIGSFYSEVEFMDPAVVASFQGTTGKDGKDIGHYTALVSSNTTQVGCGFVQKKEIYSNKFQDIFLVCNYVPTGNLLYMPLYKEGPACSECPSGSRCSERYPGLCTNEKNEYEDIPKRPKRAQAISLHPSWSLLVVLFFIQTY